MSKDTTEKPKKGRPKKAVPNPYYPYETEAQMRVATALKELQLAYSVAEPELREDIDVMFDFICNLQDEIEERMEEQCTPTSLAALNKEAEAKKEEAIDETIQEVEPIS